MSSQINLNSKSIVDFLVDKKIIKESVNSLSNPYYKGVIKKYKSLFDKDGFLPIKLSDYEKISDNEDINKSTLNENDNIQNNFNNINFTNENNENNEEYTGLFEIQDYLKFITLNNNPVTLYEFLNSMMLDIKRTIIYYENEQINIIFNNNDNITNQFNIVYTVLKKILPTYLNFNTENDEPFTFDDTELNDIVNGNITNNNDSLEKIKQYTNFEFKLKIYRLLLFSYQANFANIIIFFILLFKNDVLNIMLDNINIIFDENDIYIVSNMSILAHQSLELNNNEIGKIILKLNSNIDDPSAKLIINFNFKNTGNFITDINNYLLKSMNSSCKLNLIINYKQTTEKINAYNHGNYYPLMSNTLHESFITNNINIYKQNDDNDDNIFNKLFEEINSIDVFSNNILFLSKNEINNLFKKMNSSNNTNFNFNNLNLNLNLNLDEFDLILLSKTSFKLYKLDKLTNIYNISFNINKKNFKSNFKNEYTYLFIFVLNTDINNEFNNIEDITLFLEKINKFNTILNNKNNNLIKKGEKISINNFFNNKNLFRYFAVDSNLSINLNNMNSNKLLLKIILIYIFNYKHISEYYFKNKSNIKNLNIFLISKIYNILNYIKFNYRKTESKPQYLPPQILQNLKKLILTSELFTYDPKPHYLNTDNSNFGIIIKYILYFGIQFHKNNTNKNLLELFKKNSTGYDYKHLLEELMKQIKIDTNNKFIYMKKQDELNNNTGLNLLHVNNSNRKKVAAAAQTKKSRFLSKFFSKKATRQTTTLNNLNRNRLNRNRLNSMKLRHSNKSTNV